MQKPREIQQNASLIVRNLSDLLTWCKHWGPRWSSRSCSRWGWREGWRRGSRAPSPGSSGRYPPLQDYYNTLNLKSKCTEGEISVELYIVGINFATFSILYFWILLIWGSNESFIGCPHEMAPDGCQFEEMRAFQTRIWFDSPASVNLKTKFTFYTYLIMHRMQKKYLWGLTMGT